MLKSFQEAKSPPKNVCSCPPLPDVSNIELHFYQQWEGQKVDYYFTPVLSRIEKASIRRLIEHATEDRPAQFEEIDPPFQTFPVLKLHVDPRFAVYNAGPKLAPGMGYFKGDQLESALIALQIWALLSASKPRWLQTYSPRPSSGSASEAGSQVTRNTRRDDEADGDHTNDPAGPKTPRHARQPRSGTPELDHDLSDVDEYQLSDDEQSARNDVLDWVRKYSNNIERNVFPRSSGWEDLAVDCALEKSLTTDVGADQCSVRPKAAPPPSSIHVADLVSQADFAS